MDSFRQWVNSYPRTIAIIAVAVVPTSIPITIAAACGKLIVPAFTAAKVMATPALDDWVTSVMAIPIMTSKILPSRVSGGKLAGVTTP